MVSEQMLAPMLRTLYTDKVVQFVPGRIVAFNVLCPL